MKKQAKKKQRKEKYNTKLSITGSLDDVLKASVSKDNRTVKRNVKQGK